MSKTSPPTSPGVGAAMPARGWTSFFLPIRTWRPTPVRHRLLPRKRLVDTESRVLRSRRAVANYKRKEPLVLRQVAGGVLIHESEFCQSNAVVVQGRAGVLLIDPGVLGYEMACLANDLRELGQPVVAGFSTHP